jgi:hypothetical protein
MFAVDYNLFDVSRPERVAAQGALLRALAWPPREMWQQWACQGFPRRGPFVAWLSVRFGGAELLRVMAALRRCRTYDSAAEAIARALVGRVIQFGADR